MKHLKTYGSYYQKIFEENQNLTIDGGNITQLWREKNENFRKEIKKEVNEIFFYLGKYKLEYNFDLSINKSSKFENLENTTLSKSDLEKIQIKIIINYVIDLPIKRARDSKSLAYKDFRTESIDDLEKISDFIQEFSGSVRSLESYLSEEYDINIYDFYSSFSSSKLSGQIFLNKQLDTTKSEKLFNEFVTMKENLLNKLKPELINFIINKINPIDIPDKNKLFKLFDDINNFNISYSKDTIFGKENVVYYKHNNSKHHIGYFDNKHNFNFNKSGIELLLKQLF